MNISTAPQPQGNLTSGAAALLPLSTPSRLSRRALMGTAAAGILGVIMNGCSLGSPTDPAEAHQVDSGESATPWRPWFHYTAEQHQINDPNGLFWLDGLYHLCHQYNVDGEVHWGHATSTDLIRWTHLDPALYPDDLGQIWSGSAVVDQDNTSGLQSGPNPPVVAYFTYSARDSGTQSQGRAFSTDGGRTWTKDPANPILPNEGRRDFRDPKVLWHQRTARWVMVVTVGQQLEFLASTDLKSWSVVGTFGNGHGAHDGAWECPDLFEMPVEGRPGETRWVLSVSVIDGAPAGGSGMQYFVGSFDGTSFTNDHPASTVLWQNHGPDCYAGVTWGDAPVPDRRRLMIAWTDNWRYREVVPTSPFNGQLSTVRELTLIETPDGLRLVQSPIDSYQELRDSAVARRDLDVSGSLVLDGAEGASLDLEVELEVPPTGEAGVDVLVGPDHRTRIGYDTGSGTVFLDRSRSGVVPQRDGSSLGGEWAARFDAPLAVAGGERVRLRILVDRSSVDVYANAGRAQLSALVLPESSDTGVALFASTTARFVSVQAWSMRRT